MLSKKTTSTLKTNIPVLYTHSATKACCRKLSAIHNDVKKETEKLCIFFVKNSKSWFSSAANTFSIKKRVDYSAISGVHFICVPILFSLFLCRRRTNLYHETDSFNSSICIIVSTLINSHSF